MRRSITRVEAELSRLRCAAQTLAEQPPVPADRLQPNGLAAAMRALDARSALACARAVAAEARRRPAGLSTHAASLEPVLRLARDAAS